MPISQPNLAKALRVQRTDVLAFVGAGGKTTAMFLSAQQSRPCVITTSTHIFKSQAALADRHITVQPNEDVTNKLGDVLPNETVLLTGQLILENDRLQALSPEQLQQVASLCQQKRLPLFIEADGARMRSIKAPAGHEPAIPPFATVVTVVAGLSALGKPLTEEFVHRPEIFAALSGTQPGDAISAEAIAKVMLHPEGGLKNIPPQAHRNLVLSQAETIEQRSAANSISKLAMPLFDQVITAQLQIESGQINAVTSKVAGIILAAGASSRLGKPKQLELFLGKPFIRCIAEQALAAGLNPVIVVTGSLHDQIGAALADLPVQRVYNPEWALGQGTSVSCGVRALPDNVGAAIFMMSDQPQLRQELLRALVEQHQKNAAAVVAPLIAGKRANPVLFGWEAFPELANLTGEAGGRQVFHKFQVDYLEWFDGMMSIDIDTPEDLALLNKLARENTNHVD